MYINEELLQRLIDRLTFEKASVNTLYDWITIDEGTFEIITYKHLGSFAPITFGKGCEFEQVIDFLITKLHIWCRDINGIRNFEFSAIGNNTNMTLVTLTCFQTGCVKCVFHVKFTVNICMIVKTKQISAIVHNRLNHMVICAANIKATLVNCTRLNIQF